MAKKPDITTIASGYYSRQALNSNFENLQTGFDNTLSLDGSTPNAMGADLDMNSNDILNAQTVNAEALRLDGVLVSSSSLAASGATLFSTDHTGDGTTVAYSTTYQAFIKDNTQVYIDGVYQNKAGYSISGTTLTFSEAPPLNAAIEIVVARSLDVAGTDAANVNYNDTSNYYTGATVEAALDEVGNSVFAYNQGGTGAVDRTVKAKLQETVSVKDFGAVGDGVTDDAAAFNAALAASNTVIVPQGEYRIESTVTVGLKQRLLGVGLPKLTAPATITVIHLAGSLSELRNFELECDGANNTAPTNTNSVAVKIAHPDSIPANPLADWLDVADGIVDNLRINRFYYAIQMDVTFEWALSNITASRYQYGLALNRVKFDTYGTGGGKVVNNIHLTNMRFVGTLTSYAVPSGMIGLDFTDVFNLYLDGFSLARNEVNSRNLNVRGVFTAGYMEDYNAASYTNTRNMTFNGCDVSLDNMWVEDLYGGFTEAFYVANGSLDVRGGVVRLEPTAALFTNAVNSSSVILRMPILAGTTIISTDPTSVVAVNDFGTLNKDAAKVYNPASTGCGLIFGTGRVIYPAGETGATSNGDTDLGSGGVEFKDIYLVNAPTVSSDQNKKRDIRDLSAAEEAVAVAAKGLLKVYRLKSAYEVKGDDARLHFGIIAQELQAAFEAEDLDPWRYGVLVKNIDPETNNEILAVRYEELLTFILAAI